MVADLHTDAWKNFYVGFLAVDSEALCKINSMARILSAVIVVPLIP